MKPIYITLVILFATPWVNAQEMKQPPSRHTAFKVLVASDALLTAADTVTTIHRLQKGNWVEMNPFMGHHPSAARVTLSMVGSTLLFDALAHRMETHGHRKISKALMIGAVAIETTCVADNVFNR